jgi:hypothetical protein
VSQDLQFKKKIQEVCSSGFCASDQAPTETAGKNISGSGKNYLFDY